MRTKGYSAERRGRMHPTQIMTAEVKEERDTVAEKEVKFIVRI